MKYLHATDYHASNVCLVWNCQSHVGIGASFMNGFYAYFYAYEYGSKSQVPRQTHSLHHSKSGAHFARLMYRSHQTHFGRSS
jgi:hypothetical protein